MKKTISPFCPDCGALLPEKRTSCPYCGYVIGTPPRKKASPAQPAKKTPPAKKHAAVAKKERKATPKSPLSYALFIAAAVLVLTGAFFLSRHLKRQADEAARQKTLARFEELYQSGDYQVLCSEYHDSRYNDASFGKYSNTAEMYSLTKYPIESVDLMVKSSSDTLHSLDNIKEILRKSFYSLAVANRFRRQGFLYGEQTSVEALEQQMIDVLKNQLLLTDEEIEDGLSRYVDYQTDYSDLADVIAERLGYKVDSTEN